MVKMLKNKKDKIVTLSFPISVHLSVPEGLRISEIFFAILHTKIIIDDRKGIYHYQKQKDKKINNQDRCF